MSERPPALDVRSILEAAFDVRDEDPEYFGEWVRDVYTTKAGWHDQPDPDNWKHHASSLGECMRRHVLIRSGVEIEPLTVESRVTFQVGDIIHVLIQLGLAVHPDYTLLCHETGGVAERDGLKLAALCDAVYVDDASGAVCVIDVKSEKEYARKYREDEAWQSEAMHTAKPEHALQVKATAGVVHRTTDYRPLWGWVIYFSKDSGRIDPQLVPLGAQEVIDRLEARENAWTDYQFANTLPQRLDAFPSKGLCQARGNGDDRGKYCPVRTECLRRGA